MHRCWETHLKRHKYTPTITPPRVFHPEKCVNTSSSIGWRTLWAPELIDIICSALLSRKDQREKDLSGGYDLSHLWIGMSHTCADIQLTLTWITFNPLIHLPTIDFSFFCGAWLFVHPFQQEKLTLWTKVPYLLKSKGVVCGTKMNVVFPFKSLRFSPHFSFPGRITSRYFLCSTVHEPASLTTKTECLLIFHT